jgi:nucleotide-binding universal stress UspA family protein
MSTGKVVVREDLLSPTVGFKRILVATDFSSGSRAALDCALGLGRHFQSKIYVVHVISSGALQYVSPEGSGEALRQAKAFAADEMQRLVQSARCAESVEQVILHEGRVWPTLQEFVESNSIDLVALGTHGRTTEKKQLLGSVAEEIFRLAECPVLTVGAHLEKQIVARGGVRKVLFATNLKPHAERAAPYARLLERKQEARLTVVHVVEDQSDAHKEGHEIVREFIVKRLQRSQPGEFPARCAPDFQVRFGEASEEILKAAEEDDSDLIVLGLGARDGASGQLPSQVAYKLVCRSPCPVLTIRR